MKQKPWAMLRDFHGPWKQWADSPIHEKSHQEARVGAATASGGDVGISRFPSPPTQRQLSTSGPAMEARHGGGSLAHDDSALSGQEASDGSSRHILKCIFLS